MTGVQNQLQGNSCNAKHPYAMVLNSSVIQWGGVIPPKRKNRDGDQNCMRQILQHK